MVIRRNTRAFPAGVDISVGGQRLQVGTVRRGEQVGAAGAVIAHDPGVRIVRQRPEPCVQFGEGKEPVIAQPGEYPALRHLNRDLDLRLIPGLAHTRGHDRQDRGAVMLRHPGMGAVQPGIVPVGFDDSGFEVIRDHRPGRATRTGEHPGMGADPVLQPFRGNSFDAGVTGRPDSGDEQLRRMHFASFRIDDVDRVARVVDKHLLIARMCLSRAWADTPTSGTGAAIRSRSVACLGGHAPSRRQNAYRTTCARTRPNAAPGIPPTTASG